MDVLRARTAIAGAPAAATSAAVEVERALPAAVVVAAACVSGTWMAVELVRRDAALGSPAYDQAFFQQVIWNLDHGRGFVSSFNQGSFLGVHFSPLLVVPAGLELLWPDPRLLSLLNAVSIALAAPAAFLLLRSAFAEWKRGAYLAAGLAAAVPFTPVMQEVGRAGFHTETMAFPAALVAGWAGLTRRPALMWLSAAVPLVAKEDQVYTVAVIGLLVAVRGAGMRRHGVLLIAAAALWAIALFEFVMPALRGATRPDTVSYYEWLGQFPGSLLAPIREPAAVWSQITNSAGWTAAALLIVGLCLLPLLRPAWALLVVPPLVANLLSRHYPQPELHLQYGLLLVAPALAAAAMGGARAISIATRLLPAKAGPALLAAVVPGLLLGATVGTLPPALRAPASFGRPAALDRLSSITSVIPASAPIDVDENVAAPLASRPAVYILPRPCAGCYVVIDREVTQSPFMSESERGQLLQLLPAGRHLLADDGRFQVWSPTDG